MNRKSGYLPWSFLIIGVPTDNLTQAELTQLAGKIGGKSMSTIALQFLEVSNEQLEDLEEDLRGNVARAKFKILLGWYQRNPEGNPRLVSYLIYHQVEKKRMYSSEQVLQSSSKY